jgi:hypothetical protein
MGQAENRNSGRGTVAVNGVPAELAVGVGHSVSTDPVAAARESVTAALAGRTTGPDDLVLLFPTVDLDPWQFVEAAQEAAGPAQVVGCTSFASFTGAAQVARGTVAAYLPAGDLTFGVAAADSIGPDIYGAAKRITEQAWERAGHDAEHSVLLMLSDGLAGDQREVVRGSYAVTGSTVLLVGGAAGENQSLNSTYQFAQGKVMTNGLVAVWINSPNPVGVGVQHGWHPIGEPMIATRAEGNIVHELDGQPATEVYLRNRGSDPRLTTLRGAEVTNFSAATLDHPLGLANASGRFDVRHVLDRTDEGGLVLFGHVSEQSIVQVMAGDSNDLVDAAAAAARDAVDQLESPCRGAVVFSCTGRVAPLGDRVADEVGAVAGALSGGAVAGFFTYGEFARVTGSTGFHNATVVVLAL